MNGISARLAAASGAFSILAVFLGGGPIDQGSALGLVLLTASFVSFVVFVGYVHAVLRRAEGAAGWLATVTLIAGVLHVATRFQLLAAENGTRALSGRLADELHSLDEQAFVVSGLLLGLYVACASGVCLAHRILPAWLGWFGIGAGALTVLVGTAGLVDTDLWIPWPFLGSGIWITAASLLLAVRVNRLATHAVSQRVRAGAV